ncbi:hypothetical protein ACQFX9_09830 [Aliinostoc sp. HNIBRCY26]
MGRAKIEKLTLTTLTEPYWDIPKSAIAKKISTMRMIQTTSQHR